MVGKKLTLTITLAGHQFYVVTHIKFARSLMFLSETRKEYISPRWALVLLCRLESVVYSNKLKYETKTTINMMFCIPLRITSQKDLEDTSHATKEWWTGWGTVIDHSHLKIGPRLCRKVPETHFLSSLCAWVQWKDQGLNKTFTRGEDLWTLSDITDGGQTYWTN